MNNYNNPFYNNNNFHNNLMQPPTNQMQTQCYAVSSRDEANKIPIQLGVMYIILNKLDKEIYIKQWNSDGLVDMEVYKNEKAIPEKTEEKDYSKELSELNAKIEEMQKMMNKGEPNV